MKKTDKKKKQMVKAYYSGVRLQLPPGQAHKDKRRKNRSHEKAELKRQLQNTDLQQ